MPGLKDWLFGSEEKMKKFDTMSPEQKQIFGQLMQLLSGGGLQDSLQLLQGMLNPESDVYKNMEAPYLNQFNEQILPGIAERFAGSGALSSSGFGQALGGAGAQLQANLANLREQGRQNALQNILGLTQTGISTPTQGYIQKQASPGFLSQAASGVLSGFARGFGG